MTGLPRRSGTTERHPSALSSRQQRKEDDMTRLLSFILVALAAGISPVLAAEPSSQSNPPTANTGSPDTAGGATEQTESPSSAGSKIGKMGEKNLFPPSTPSTSEKMGTPGQTTPNPAAPSSGD